MPRQLRYQSPGTTCHITVRGNAKQDIYTNDAERLMFLECLAGAMQEFDWTCHAFCLMSNHYHLVLQTREANLAIGMQHLNGQYAQMFNYRHGRTGHLLQGRFHSKVVDNEAYFFAVSAYIVLNPVRHGLVDHPDQWQWSSYRKTACGGNMFTFLDPGFLLSLLGDDIEEARNIYTEFIEEHIERPRASQRPSSDPVQDLQKLSLKLIFYESDKNRDECIKAAHFVHGYNLREIADHCGIAKATVGHVVKKRKSRAVSRFEVDGEVDGA
jgi:putative transposase